MIYFKQVQGVHCWHQVYQHHSKQYVDQKKVAASSFDCNIFISENSEIECLK